MIHIVNYGLGNLGSITSMLRRISIDSEIIDNPEELQDATKIILPGVGSFDSGIINLRNLGWIEALNKKVIENRTPILGICLGMQLMTLSSEEGEEKGLGWIDAHTIKFTFNVKGLKIPHMGWNEVNILKETNLLNSNPILKQRYYFVHSYNVQCTHQKDVLTTTNYGINFVSSFQHENIFGVQFHPEKSHKFGMQLLENFANLC